MEAVLGDCGLQRALVLVKPWATQILLFVCRSRRMGMLEQGF